MCKLNYLLLSSLCFTHVNVQLTDFVDKLFLGSQQFLRQLRNPPHCNKPEGSLLCSHERGTCPYQVADKPSPQPSAIFNNLFKIILPSTPRCSKRIIIFKCPHSTPIRISLLSPTCHISHHSHLPLTSTNHDAPPTVT